MRCVQAINKVWAGGWSGRGCAGATCVGVGVLALLLWVLLC